MKFFISGEYGNGDAYADYADDIDELAFYLGSIKMQDHDNNPSDERILSDTIKIETEEV